MAFADIGQVTEINNELILFQELLNIESNYYNSLLISQVGRIAQHLVEFLAYQKELIKGYDVYNRPFKDLLVQCYFIPEIIQEYIITIYEYRRDVDYSLKHEKRLNDKKSSFFKSFYDLLNWFEDYCRYEFYNRENIEFKEIEKTKKLLIKHINNKSEDSLQNRRSSFNKDYDTELDEENMDSVLATLKDICKLGEKIIKQSDDNKNEILGEIDKVSSQIKEIHKSLHEHRIITRKRLKNAKDNEYKLEKIYNEFNHKSAEKIKNSIDNSVNKTSLEYKEVVNDLIDKFGESWDKLDELSQKYIITSKLAYSNLCNFGPDIDYSGVCLSVTKALELELKKRFIDDFLEYLDSAYNQDYSKYHSFLYDYNAKKNQYYVIGQTRRTLGVIPHILGSSPTSKNLSLKERENNSLRLIEYSKYALFDEDKHEDSGIEKILIDYGSRINSIKVKYRNKAAHVDTIKQKQAKECLEYVIDVERFLIIMLNSFDKEKPKMKG